MSDKGKEGEGALNDVSVCEEDVCVFLCVCVCVFVHVCVSCECVPAILDMVADSNFVMCTAICSNIWKWRSKFYECVHVCAFGCVCDSV